ncbi:MAG: nicotinate (nicotinamide) nucleotide adenylyltransferase [Curvibacter sp.]|nr:MAG: nicotinate (nicotinamide) nucleotide adenylyltransferase [Curvibacter sp.]
MGVTLSRPRLGVFGGAFDPPHRAHVALAEAALQQLQLQQLHVLPTGQAAHRAGLSPGEHRLAMARLAFAGMPGVVVDEREFHRAGPSYTVDTLDQLQAEFPDAELVLIIGADQARAFGQWHRHDEILRKAIISVAGREQSAAAGGQTELQDLPGGRWERLQWPLMSVSATDIRSRVAQGLGIEHLVPAGVARYIEQHHLYKSA